MNRPRPRPTGVKNPIVNANKGGVIPRGLASGAHKVKPSAYRAMAAQRMMKGGTPVHIKDDAAPAAPPVP